MWLGAMGRVALWLGLALAMGSTVFLADALVIAEASCVEGGEGLWVAQELLWLHMPSFAQSVGDWREAPMG